MDEEKMDELVSQVCDHIEESNIGPIAHTIEFAVRVLGSLKENADSLEEGACFDVAIQYINGFLASREYGKLIVS